MGADGWPVCGLVPAAAGVGARLARGEVFGSHAGGVLEERGREGAASAEFLGGAEQPVDVVLGRVSHSRPLGGRIQQCSHGWQILRQELLAQGQDERLGID